MGTPGATPAVAQGRQEARKSAVPSPSQCRSEGKTKSHLRTHKNVMRQARDGTEQGWEGHQKWALPPVNLWFRTSTASFPVKALTLTHPKPGGCCCSVYPRGTVPPTPHLPPGEALWSLL